MLNDTYEILKVGDTAQYNMEKLKYFVIKTLMISSVKTLLSLRFVKMPIFFKLFIVDNTDEN